MSPTTPLLRQQYRARQAAVLASCSPNLATPCIRSTLRKLSNLADEFLLTLWRQAGLGKPCALLAVGGFGRRELFPHSDIDVLVLLPDSPTTSLDAARSAQIETFIRSCWDTGLEIGSSVRTVGECLEEATKDLTVQTALLESRCITGSRTLVADFRTRFRSIVDPQAFFIAKTLEMQQRHGKYEDTPYALEPHCKESPGGLRDLHVILWVAKAAGFAEDWGSLARAGLATPFEIRQIRRNEALLQRIRTLLHVATRRREDRLLFDLQNSVAQSFGYLAPEGDPRAAARPGERLMRQYYLAAKAVTQLREIVLLNIEERLRSRSPAAPRRIDEHFFDNAGMLDIASDDFYRRDPHAILQTFFVFQSEVGIQGLSARTLRALYHVQDLIDHRFRNDPVNQATFLRILQHPSGLTHTLRLMNDTSVLGRFLPPFLRIVGQMQHDLFHVYTVDQHTMMVLRNVRRFFLPEHVHEYPFCSQLAADWDKPWLLYVAALFHDIAKGRGGDHSVLGAKEVRRFCKRYAIAAEDAQLIEFLVREHLTMSRIAQKCDHTDPSVIAQFARYVRTERQLTALYLFTVADIRGTSPKVWNSWKSKLLADLYHSTSQMLGGHVPDIHADIRERQHDAIVELALHAQPYLSHKPLWDTLDAGYFMRHDAVEIAWHARKLSRYVESPTPIVRARPSPVVDGLQVLVYTRDQADLFARICGYFERSGLSILDARIHTTLKGYALDTFQVVSPDPTERYRELVNMVESELAHTIAIAGPLPEPGKGRVSRRVRSFPLPPRVRLRPDETGQRWVLNLSASDRVGLLYAVARVLARHGIDLQLAKVITLGERVEDTFLIRGSALQNQNTQLAIETELLAALG
ncbi:[protein-PII] uridylyltransferase [Candidatus Symbiobacter mobilis]|uniref:Bifunctional uridylyltransferase/uridylyl-removing enzyme n=1 Tax=Candidatus Symbiobacter mobilis CR TaxID=946483 RepID=U5N7V8_9BURK|nr:[protein-PII] uridylyltransferase [Candidatus Symbiobacter mobilis]AGX87477.1 protein PII uridylyltransferase [Candidatus Symbiobacter mobilis CR]